MATERPHFAVPFTRTPDGRKVQVVEQDTAEHVMGQELVVAQCPLGAREARPEFGWPWPEFANAPIDVDSLESALRKFVPSSKATAREVADLADASVRHIEVEVEA
jgi:hypothetical protein